MQHMTPAEGVFGQETNKRIAMQSVQQKVDCAFQSQVLQPGQTFGPRTDPSSKTVADCDSKRVFMVDRCALQVLIKGEDRKSPCETALGETGGVCKMHN